MIFVFGSNLAGHHGGGAARVAHLEHGAIMGVGEGLHGESYALPTMDHRLEPLSLRAVDDAVTRFLDLADLRPDLIFQVTRVGCGIAGFSDEAIAPLFTDAPSNCWFDRAWEPWLPGRTFWGSFP